MESFMTPYRLSTAIIIKVLCTNPYPANIYFGPSDVLKMKHWLFIKDIIEQNEYSPTQLVGLIESKCTSEERMEQRILTSLYDAAYEINRLFVLTKDMRSMKTEIDPTSFAGLYLRKFLILFDRLTHQALSRLHDDYVEYFCEMYPKNPIAVRRKEQRNASTSCQTPRMTRSSMHIPKAAEIFVSQPVTPPVRTIYQINHEISRLQSNELQALNPKDLYESLKSPNNTCKSDAAFLRYLNLLRVNESVGSKHLLLAYFDMVSDSVSRSYSALNYAIWYMHHGEYKRAIECLQECYCCAQAADDDKCLLMALMWLARILIQAQQKNSSKYNVTALIELVRKRSHKAGMAYVQAMSSMTLEQLTGPIDDSESLKKSSETIKQVAQSNKQQNLLLATSNQSNPLDKEDGLPSAEVLAVRNSMNDVLAMYYALLSAHLNLLDANQSSALASQTLLHFDLIEKCGKDDLFLLNESIFIAVRNLAHHVWNTTRDIGLVREILVDLCSNKIPVHRTDTHSMWRQAYSEISFEYYIEQENWSEAMQMISVIRETDQDGAQLRHAELLQLMGSYEEALQQVEDLIKRIDYEESNLTDPAEPTTQTNGGYDDQQMPNSLPTGMFTMAHSEPSVPAHSTLSIEHKAFIKSKALLLRATLLEDETKILESLQYATDNRFMHIRTSCLLQLAQKWVDKPDTIMDSIVIEVFANGTRLERRRMRELLNTQKQAAVNCRR